MLIKRGIFYTHANYQKIESNIFSVFYLFHRTYTKISMIFESVSNFLHKIKHTSQFCIKEKGKGHCSYGRPARLWPKPAHALNPPSPLSLQDADGEVPPVSFVSTTHGGSATAPAAVGEGLGPRARATAPPQPRDPIAITQTRSTLSLPPRPREWWVAAVADHRPATRAR